MEFIVLFVLAYIALTGATLIITALVMVARYLVELGKLPPQQLTLPEVPEPFWPAFITRRLSPAARDRLDRIHRRLVTPL